MMRKILIAAMAAITGIPATFAAEPLDIKPGLWDVEITMTYSGAPIYIEAMNDAQRASYAKSWATTVGKPETSRDQQCITAKDIQETAMFQGLADDKQCKKNVSKQTAKAWVATMDCKDAKTTTHVDLDYAAASPTQFAGTMKSTATTPNGKTVADLKMTGKWAAAACPAEDEEEPEDDSGN